MAGKYVIVNEKLHEPRIAVNSLQRGRLLQRLAGAADKKLTLIVAPAGYGKSVLVSQFAKSHGSRVVWYQLDSFDNDPVVFINYLIAGLKKSIDGLDIDVPESIESSNAFEEGSKGFISHLIAELENSLRSPVLIIFDDMHYISEPKVFSILQHFLKYLPKQIHVIITSREHPNMNLSKIKAAGLLEMLDKGDLAFNAEETAGILNNENSKGFSDDIVKLLYKKTEGWIIALAFVKMLIKDADKYETINDIYELDSKKDIYSYIALEIFEDLSCEIQEFLLSTSVFDTFTAEMCRSIVENIDADEMISRLEDMNLFMIQNVNGRHTYRYHHLFQQFLLSKLGERERILYKKASDYFSQKGYMEKSIEYLILSDDADEAAKAVKKTGIELLKQGKLVKVNRWIKYIETSGKSEDPELMLVKSATLIYKGSFDQAERLLDKAIKGFEAVNDEEGLLNALIYKARVLVYTTSYEASLNLIDSVVLQFKGLPISKWYDVLLEKTYSLIMKGQFEEAAAVLKNGMSLALKEEEYRVAEYFSRYMSVLYYLRGEYSEAVRCYEKSVVVLGEDLDSLERHSVDFFIASLYRDRGELDKALRLIQKNIHTKKRLGMTEDLYAVYYNLASIYRDLKDFENAFKYVELSEEIFSRGGGNTAFSLTVCSLKSILLADAGRLAEAKNLINESLMKLEEKSDFFMVVSQLYGSIIYLRLGNVDKALTLCEQAIDKSEKIGMKVVVSSCCAIKASILWMKDDKNNAVYYANKSLKLAAAEKYIQVFITNPETFPCIKIAIQYKMELDFVEEVLRNIGDEAIPLLVEFMRSPERDIRMRAVHLLKHVDRNSILREFEIMFFTPSLNTRKYALEAINHLKQGTKGRTKDKLDPGKFSKAFIFCFGAFELYSAEEPDLPIEWRTTKAKEMLAYLVHNREKLVSRDTILSDIWPEANLELAVSLFHTNLYHLRKILEQCGVKGAIMHRQNGYMLNMDQLSCDAVYIDNVVKSMCGELGSKEVRCLEQAAGLFRGEYLQEFGTEWIRTNQNNYNMYYLSIMDRVAEYYIRCDDYKKAEESLRSIININPFVEEVYVKLMMIYSKTGNNDALRVQYERLRKVLAEEFGIEPNPKTKKIFNALYSSGD